MAYEVVKTGSFNTGTLKTKYRDTTTGKVYNSLAEYTSAQNTASQEAISSAYTNALNALTSSQGASEKAYQTGKRKTLASTAMSNIQSGMANTTNMASASNAYDAENRAAYNASVGSQTSDLYTSYANTLANLYNTNTSQQLGSSQLSTQSATNSQNNALQRYIALLNSGSSSTVSAGAEI